MEFRKFEKSNILYVILIDEYTLERPFMAPKNVNPNSIDYLKFLPKNIYQLENPSFYLFHEINNLSANPYTIVFFKRNDTEEIIKFVQQINVVIVFLIDNNKLEDRNIKERINQLNKRCIFYINLTENESEDGESINNFFREIVDNRDLINEYLGIHKEEFESYMSVDYSLNELKHYSYFLPTKTNFLLYNIYLGNFGYPYEITEDKIKEHAKKAMKQATTFNRLNLFLPQLKAFDNLYNVFKQTKSPKKYYSEYNPLYFSLPFHNPDIKDFFSDKSSPLAKKIFQALQIEQTSNYVNVVESNDKDIDEDIVFYQTVLQVIKERLRFLDNSSFLMSSFNFAPYVRFPILGKSIYRELSFIGPKNFSKFLTLKSQLKLSDTISKIGNKISKSIFSDEFKIYLKNRNSQIISITDLPIEWAEIDEVPLCFSHDITRLPETNFNNHLQSFVTNSLLDFTIKKNIIHKTLVVLGADDAEFIKWHKLIFDLAKEENFIVEVCTKIDEFIKVVKKHNPEFLIIDTHGGFDETSKQTYLMIGKEKLTQDIIISNNISAPLIFLSACGTAPIYGTFNPIANAFLQLGAKSVTSTYLPVEIDNSTMVYLGILNNLNKVSNAGTFENWLEYICYNIRSSYLHRIYAHQMLDSKIDPNVEKDYHNYTQNIQNFNQRKIIFKAAKNFEKTLCKKSKKGFTPRPYEFLYYTNIGRGDLVLFEKYKELFEELNYS